MNPLPTVIIEDIPANREALKQMLGQECPYVQVLGAADNIQAAKELIMQNHPKLVFLDIELKGATSFDLLDMLNREDAIDFEIIFFTAHGKFEYANRAIEFSALPLLTKPVDPKKLRRHVEKAYEKIKDRQNLVQFKTQIEALLQSLNNPGNFGRIAFHLTKGVIEFVEVDDILYLKADTTVTQVHLLENKITAVKNLGFYKKLLLPNYHFFAISNSLLINLKHVKRYSHRDLCVTFNNGVKVFASRRGGQNLRDFLSRNKSEFGSIQDNLLERWIGRLFGRR